MIARLSADATHLDNRYIRFLEALKRSGFEGEIAPDYASRTVLATDNSLYQRLPQAAVFPRHRDDVERLARLAGREEYRTLVLTPRGGGTGTNGQSLTDGIVVDVSRHMNRILDIDVERRRVRVQAGVVKDQLNAALRPHGLFFAPELSTSNRATLGGMIATDASGQGSCEYGKTRNHVLELDSVLIGGERLVTGPVSEAELEARCAEDGAAGRAYRVAREIIDTQAEAIAATFPPLNRCLTGYDLAHLREDDGRFNLNSVLCGAEGSLALTCEAVLNVLPIPRHSTLVNVRYASFMDALADAKALMTGGASPTSIETVDDTVLGLAMEDFVWEGVADFFPASAPGEPPIAGINLVEFNDDDHERLRQRVERFCDHLSHDTSVARLGFTLAEGRDAIGRVYAMRKRSVGLLGNVQGEKRPLPFVEDTAVPPEHLADYIAEFRALLDARGLSYGMFGHVDAGVLHVRPALDMKDPAQQAMIREISDAVAKLTHKYHGLLWGEHGKGVRSEYSPTFFGDLYPSLQRLKGAFDPYNQLNPGKIASPLSMAPEPVPAKAPDAVPAMAPGTATAMAPDAVPAKASDGSHNAATQAAIRHDPNLLAIDGVPMRGDFDRQIDERVWQSHADAVYCNGNGACYNYDPDDAMCPSWKATRDRVHSPKGRASLMREWLRLQGEAGIDVVEESRRKKQEGTFGFLRHLPGRALNSAKGKDDFSHQVYDAMAGCLACKSCAGQCPVKVNVPAFRSQFLEVYHGRYLRPLRDYLVGGLEFLLPWLAPLAPLYNAALGNRLVDRLMTRGVGMADSPRLSRARLKPLLTAWGIAEATPVSLGRLTERQKARSVILVQDAFTSHFEARLVADVVELLSRLDIRVFVAPFAPNGKPLHVQGFLGAFERTAKRQANRLKALADSGVALVGIDPAMTLTYRQEYVTALGSNAVPEVLMLQEWLLSLGDTLVPPGLDLSHEEPFSLMSHCTEKTQAPGSPKAWQQVFAHFGLTLKALPSGCCGMSGTYGHEARNLATSKTIYAQSWQPVVEEQGASGRLVATGYSCRSQAQRLSDTHLPHPLQGLLGALRRAG